MRKTTNLPPGFQGAGNPVLPTNQPATGTNATAATQPATRSRTTPSNSNNLTNNGVPAQTPPQTRTKRIHKKTAEAGRNDTTQEKKKPLSERRTPVRQRRLKAASELKSPGHNKKTTNPRSNAALIKSDPVELPHDDEFGLGATRPFRASSAGALDEEALLPSPRKPTEEELPVVRLIKEAPERKMGRKEKLSRWASTNKIMRSFSKKSGEATPKEARAEKADRKKSSKPTVTLFRRKDKEAKGIAAIQTPIETKQPKKPAEQPLLQLAGLRLPGDEGKAFITGAAKSTCDYMQRILTDENYASIRPQFKQSMAKQKATEYVDFLEQMATFTKRFGVNPNDPAALEELTAIVDKYIDEKTAGDVWLNVPDALIKEARAYLEPEKEDGHGLLNFLTTTVYKHLSASAQEPYFVFVEAYRAADVVDRPLPLTATGDRESFKLFQSILGGAYGPGAQRDLAEYLQNVSYTDELLHFINTVSELPPNEPLSASTVEMLLARFIDTENPERENPHTAPLQLNLQGGTVQNARALADDPQKFHAFLQENIADELGHMLQTMYLSFRTWQSQKPL